MKLLKVLLLPPGWDASPLRVTPAVMSPVPIYTPGWRETMWVKVSCLRKQHDDRDWASNHRPAELKSNALTTTPPPPIGTYVHLIQSNSCSSFARYKFLRENSIFPSLPYHCKNLHTMHQTVIKGIANFKEPKVFEYLSI